MITALAAGSCQRFCADENLGRALDSVIDFHVVGVRRALRAWILGEGDRLASHIPGI